MSEILYYPYINLPKTDWTLRTLLYYNTVGSIVPQDYFYAPETNYDSFMLELVREELVIPINPLEVLDRPWDVTRPFLELIERNPDLLEISQSDFRIGNNGLLNSQKFIGGFNRADKFDGALIHADKFDDNVFYSLQELGLAERTKGSWYLVEKNTANSLMYFLATIVGEKTNRIPTTDYVKPEIYKQSFHSEQKKRETLLTNLIPFPEDIDLNKLKRFKERHFDLLDAFSTRIELIALNPQIQEGTPLFHQHLSELLQRKQELAAKMSENNFKKILFGTVFGLIGAYQGLTNAETTSAVIGGIPGFASAVYSALQIERAENIFDQTGLKYLALADKRLR